MTNSKSSHIRINEAFATVQQLLCTPDELNREVSYKKDGGEVTRYDLLINDLLLTKLKSENDGWVSEESDASSRPRENGILWVVDPIDGTKEFSLGIDEWSVSIGAVRAGAFEAAGIYNPLSGFRAMLWREEDGTIKSNNEVGGVNLNTTHSAPVLVSNTEHAKGRWAKFSGDDFELYPCGSIALKLGYVANGVAPFTATVQPKNVWDIAAGIMLINASGGIVMDLDGNLLDDYSKFQNGLSKGLVACNHAYRGQIKDLLERTQSTL